MSCIGVPCRYNADCNSSDSKPCCADVLFDLLSTTADFLSEKKIEYYVWAGTLLGGLRNADIIPYTADVDLVIMDEQAMQKLDKTQDLDLDADFSWDGYGKLLRGCEVKPRAAGAVERSWTFNDQTLPYMDVYSKSWSEFAPYTKYMKGSKTVTIRGRTFPAPENAEYVMEGMYGKDWRTPKEAPHGGQLKNPKKS